MRSDQVYLSYYQAMVFMFRIDEIRKESDNFNDEIAIYFENYVIERLGEIVLFYPQFLLKIIPHANKFCISRKNFDYLCELTNVNPLNKKDYHMYLPKIKQFEEEVKGLFYDGDGLKKLV